jgi:hypothetical protein
MVLGIVRISACYKSVPKCGIWTGSLQPYFTVGTYQSLAREDARLVACQHHDSPRESIQVLLNLVYLVVLVFPVDNDNSFGRAFGAICHRAAVNELELAGIVKCLIDKRGHPISGSLLKAKHAFVPDNWNLVT